GHRLAHRNRQDERRRSASLPARRAHQDRRASSHGSDRRATALRLRAGGRQGCGLKTSLTDERRLTADIIELARQYGRYGYRKVAALLRQGGLDNQRQVGRAYLAT